jgi:hypothetical protein
VRHREDERGQTTLLIVGLAVVLLMMAAVVTDASAAYLQRQELDTLADGAALTAADAGASGREAYSEGLSAEIRLDATAAREAALQYLVGVHAFTRYPGLTFEVSLDPTTHHVIVTVRAPLRLPLRVPGSPGHAEIGARSAAGVGLDR